MSLKRKKKVFEYIKSCNKNNNLQMHVCLLENDVLVTNTFEISDCEDEHVFALYSDFSGKCDLKSFKELNISNV